MKDTIIDTLRFLLALGNPIILLCLTLTVMLTGSVIHWAHSEYLRKQILKDQYGKD